MEVEGQKKAFRKYSKSLRAITAASVALPVFLAACGSNDIDQRKSDTTIESASADLEALSTEIREMISKEFPGHEWEVQDGIGGFDSSVCQNPDNDPHADPTTYDSTAYTANMWVLPTEVDGKVGQRLIENFLRIAERYGYTGDHQHREGNEDVEGQTSKAILDVGGPHPGSNIGFAFDRTIVINGRIGCLPEQASEADTPDPAPNEGG